MYALICSILLLSGSTEIEKSVYMYFNWHKSAQHLYYLKVSADTINLCLIEYINAPSDITRIPEIIFSDRYVVEDGVILTNGNVLEIIDGGMKLRVRKLEDLASGTVFGCTRRFYESGKIRFWGQWDGEQQDGTWYYFDRRAKVTQVDYDCGKVVRKVENPNLHPILQRIFSEAKLSNF